MLVRDPVALRGVIESSGLPFAEIAARAQVTPSFIGHLAPPVTLRERRIDEAPCPFAWSTAAGPVPCMGASGHPGRHAASNRPRRQSCTPAVAMRLALALGKRVEQLFELRGPDDPSTGPLPVQTHARTPRTSTSERHSAPEQISS